MVSGMCPSRHRCRPWTTRSSCAVPMKSWLDIEMEPGAHNAQYPRRGVHVARGLVATWLTACCN